MDKEKSFIEEFVNYVHKLDERITIIEKELQQEKNTKEIKKALEESWSKAKSTGFKF